LYEIIVNLTILLDFEKMVHSKNVNSVIFSMTRLIPNMTFFLSSEWEIWKDIHAALFHNECGPGTVKHHNSYDFCDTFQLLWNHMITWKSCLTAVVTIYFHCMEKSSF